MEQKDQDRQHQPAGESEIRTPAGGERATPPGERALERFLAERDGFIYLTAPIVARFRR